MRPEPVWLTLEIVLALHDDLIEEYEGSQGILNTGALESTLARPRQLNYHEPEVTIAALASAYGHGLVKNHCFNDGNKRTALDAMYVFLKLNNYRLIAPEVEAVMVVVGVATGEIGQDALTQWVATNLERL